METIIQLAIFPVTVVMFGISLAAIYDVARRTYTSNGSKSVWTILIIFFNVLGAALYYIYGRRTPQTH